MFETNIDKLIHNVVKYLGRNKPKSYKIDEDLANRHLSMTFGRISSYFNLSVLLLFQPKKNNRDKSERTNVLQEFLSLMVPPSC